MLQIREVTEVDFEKIWPIFQTIASTGDTYAYPTDITKSEGRRLWLDLPRKTFVAEDESELLGTYYIKTNQAGPGAHVCNCGYMVRASARGRGIAHCHVQAFPAGRPGTRLRSHAIQLCCVLYGLAGLFRLKTVDGWLLTLGLAQAGEFDFVLVSFSLQNHVISPDLAATLSLVVALSMLLTPALFILNPGTRDALNKRRFETLTLGATYRFNKHNRLLSQ